uniref:Uncharacterized protein n=1 Tax=Panagrolaimus sp. PS1159 TaxID=55785 RepID=A0AC35F262_9BILA
MIKSIAPYFYIHKLTIILLLYANFLAVFAEPNEFCEINKIYYSNESCHIDSAIFQKMITKNYLCSNGALLGFYPPSDAYIFLIQDYKQLKLNFYKSETLIDEKIIPVNLKNITVLEAVIKQQVIFVQYIKNDTMNTLVLNNVESSKISSSIFDWGHINQTLYIQTCDYFYTFTSHIRTLITDKMEYIINSFNSTQKNYTYDATITSLEVISPYKINIKTDTGLNIPFQFGILPTATAVTATETSNSYADSGFSYYVNIFINVFITLIIIITVIGLYHFRKKMCFCKKSENLQRQQYEMCQIITADPPGLPQTIQIARVPKKCEELRHGLGPEAVVQKELPPSVFMAEQLQIYGEVKEACDRVGWDIIGSIGNISTQIVPSSRIMEWKKQKTAADETYNVRLEKIKELQTTIRKIVNHIGRKEFSDNDLMLIDMDYDKCEAVLSEEIVQHFKDLHTRVHQSYTQLFENTDKNMGLEDGL